MTQKIDPIAQDVLFLNRRGKKLTRAMIFTIIRGLANKINLKKKISPHTFRHSFATRLLEAGINIRVIQELLGHTHVTTTELYTHVMNRNKSEVISPIDLLD